LKGTTFRQEVTLADHSLLRSTFLGRASWRRDYSTLHLLTPGKDITLPFSRGRFRSRQWPKGGSLLFRLSLPQRFRMQLHCGTGMGVSSES